MPKRKIECPSIPVEVYDAPHERAFIYVIASGPYMKIGITRDLKKRIKGVECHNPHEVRLICYRRVPAHYARRAEMQIHAELAAHQHRGEWFTADLETIMASVKRAVYDANRWNDLAQRAVRQEKWEARAGLLPEKLVLEAHAAQEAWEKLCRENGVDPARAPGSRP